VWNTLEKVQRITHKGFKKCTQGNGGGNKSSKKLWENQIVSWEISPRGKRNISYPNPPKGEVVKVSTKFPKMT